MTIPGEAGAGAADAFPPIADYAFLSDRETVALVAPSGDVEWLCLPRPDGPSVFGAMLDRGAGRFRVGPADERVPAGRRYVPGTNVLETTWATPTGWLVVRDALLIGPRDDGEAAKDGQDTLDEPSHRSERTLLRELRCVHGAVDVTVRCDPAFGYGVREPDWSREGDVAVARADADDPVLRLSTDLPLDLTGGSATTSPHHMREGERAFVALAWGDEAPRDLDEARRRRAATEDFWRDWLEQGSFPDHPWRAHLQRSALVLKGLQYRPTGALLAAATTSLPEQPGGERNWDYRYSWIRDATFALWGLHTLGFDREAVDFFRFVLGRVAGGEHLQVLYGIGGETDLTERTLDHLSGYEDSRPVRVGNAAFAQDQHDIWGAMLDSSWLHVKAVDDLSDRGWELLCPLVESAVEHWREPDRGIWEVRGEPQHFVSSKIMCWVACDRGALLALRMGHPEQAERWHAEADLIHRDVLAQGLDERGSLVQAYGSSALDASTLLAVLLRFLPGDHPVARTTVLAIADELTRDGLVLRYRTGETDDGLPGGEGSFLICSFWLVSALVEIGEISRARLLCEKLISLASPLDLFAEEIDPASGRHLGNFPQAFTHLGLINAVTHLIRAEAGARTHPFRPN